MILQKGFILFTLGNFHKKYLDLIFGVFLTNHSARMRDGEGGRERLNESERARERGREGERESGE